MSAKATSKALLLAALCLAVFALATSALGQTVRSGNLVVTIEGGITPRKLPRKTPAPITLTVSGSLQTADGSHPPALKTLHLEFDRHGQLNTEGLPACTAGQLQSTLTTTAERVCKDSLIGTGLAKAQIALPEQAPFNASGKLLIFNGPPQRRQAGPPPARLRPRPRPDHLRHYRGNRQGEGQIRDRGRRRDPHHRRRPGLADRL